MLKRRGYYLSTLVILATLLTLTQRAGAQVASTAGAAPRRLCIRAERAERLRRRPSAVRAGHLPRREAVRIDNLAARSTAMTACCSCPATSIESGGWWTGRAPIGT